MIPSTCAGNCADQFAQKRRFFELSKLCRISKSKALPTPSATRFASRTHRLCDPLLHQDILMGVTTLRGRHTCDRAPVLGNANTIANADAISVWPEHKYRSAVRPYMHNSKQFLAFYFDTIRMSQLKRTLKLNGNNSYETCFQQGSFGTSWHCVFSFETQRFLKAFCLFFSNHSQFCPSLNTVSLWRLYFCEPNLHFKQTDVFRQPDPELCNQSQI